MKVLAKIEEINFKAFLRCSVHTNGTDGWMERQPTKVMPQVMAITINRFLEIMIKLTRKLLGMKRHTGHSLVRFRYNRVNTKNVKIRFFVIYLKSFIIQQWPIGHNSTVAIKALRYLHVVN